MGVIDARMNSIRTIKDGVHTVMQAPHSSFSPLAGSPAGNLTVIDFLYEIGVGEGTMPYEWA